MELIARILFSIIPIALWILVALVVHEQAKKYPTEFGDGDEIAIQFIIGLIATGILGGICFA